MHTLSAGQLRAVAAANAVNVGENAAKIDIIEALERARFKDTPMLMLGSGAGIKKRSRSDLPPPPSPPSSGGAPPLPSLKNNKKKKRTEPDLVVVVVDDVVSDSELEMGLD